MRLVEWQWKKHNGVRQVLHVLADHKFVDGNMEERAA
jgi:hypothetical protein